MEPIKCFWMEETGSVQRYLRQYHSSCPAPWRFLKGMLAYDIVSHQPNTTISLDSYNNQEGIPHELWPSTCDCGHVFDKRDERDIFPDRIYRRTDSGETLSLRDAPVGAMWNAWWFPKCWQGADGISLHVMCPGQHEWCVDARCSNCTLPEDSIHKCWTRQGTPPDVDVSKAYGPTCSAGGGSIQTKDWHGFLRHGCLIDA